MAFLCQSRGEAAATAPHRAQCVSVSKDSKHSSSPGWAGRMAFRGSWGVCLLVGSGDGVVAVFPPAHSDPRRQGTCERSRQPG